MNPPDKENPEALELRARPPAAARLNRRLIVVLVGILGIAVLLALMWSFRDPSPSLRPKPKPQQNVERVAHAEGLSSLPRDYAGLPKTPRLGAPMGELGGAILKTEREAGLPELPERPSFQRDPEEDALRNRRLKELAEADQAAKATVFFQVNRAQASRMTASSAVSTPPRADAAFEGAQWPRATLPSADTSTDSNKQSDKRAFVEKDVAKDVYASATLQTPRSSHQLMAGTIIAAALLTGIQSDLPGQVIASVTQNIYDSVSGKELLIPQGSRLLGEYDSGVSFGQRRILLVWTRLVMPDGSSIVLDRLPATDPQGYAGVEDKVDWHWRRIFSGAAISTLLGAGAELAAPENRDENGRVVIAAREGAQDTINQVGQEITKRNLDIQPTLTARPGLPVRVIVNRDLVLRPYREAL